MYIDSLKNLRADSEYVAMLRNGADWRKVKTLCEELPRPVNARDSVRDVVLRVYPSMTPLLAGDVANYTMDELGID